MRGHVVTLEPSVRGALWELSRMFLGRPFCIKRMVFAGTIRPEVLLLTFEGRVGLGDQEISFTVPLEILTSVLTRVDEWHQSEQAAFLGLSSVFAELRMPFTVHEMVAGLLTVEKPRRYGKAFVARTVSRVVRFQGDCGFRKDNHHFAASIFVWETQEQMPGKIIPWGWEYGFPKIFME